MSEIVVEINGSVAIMWPKGDCYCWILKEENPHKPKRCTAPLLYNVEQGVLFEKINIQDEFPYRLVSKMLLLKNKQNTLMTSILACIDAEVSHEEKMEFAEIANKTLASEKGEDLFYWLKKKLTGKELPQESTINHRVLFCLNEKLRKLIFEIF